MGKKRGQRRPKPPSRDPKRNQHHRETVRKTVIARLISFLRSGYTVVAVIVTFAGLFVFWPRIEVASPSDAHPLALRYVITNRGPFPIHNVVTACGVDEIKFIGGGSLGGFSVQFANSGEEHRASLIRADESHTFSCENAVAADPRNIEAARVALNVKYTHLKLIRRNQWFCYQLRRDEAALRWFPRACDWVN